MQTGKLFFQEVSVTQANTAIAPLPDPGVGASQAYYTEEISIYNAGSNPIFIALNEVATSSKVKIAAGATLTIKGQAAHVTAIGVICATGLTSTALVYVSLARR